ncbi:hypothetical protein AB0D94_29335 [Streptomyces sp. NPDC048255]|uniref:hypothetical protein n=1 Tax=Streptomyces sp. NPDC048255 TaxID=3154713 RepID=UPI0033C77398
MTVASLAAAVRHPQQSVDHSHRPRLRAVWAESAFYGANVVGVRWALSTRFSTHGADENLRQGDDRAHRRGRWTAIKYPKAVWDEEGQW